MDWIDKKPSSNKGSSKRKSRSKSRPSLRKQVAAAVSQPDSVWAAAFDHSISAIRWPSHCDVATTWTWSTVILEQAEVLVRAGASAGTLAGLVNHPKQSDEKSRLAAVSGLMHQPLESVLPEWLEQSDAYPQAALGVIATVWHLAEHASRNDPDFLRQWVESVVEQIARRQSEQCECLLGNLIFHCELPLLLSLLTANPGALVSGVISQAMDDLAEYLENGQQHIEAWLAHGAAYLRSSLASVFRCRVLADHFGLRSWYSPQRKALTGLLECAAHWARSDGTQLLGLSEPSKESQAIWKAISKLAASTKSTRRILNLAGLIDDGRKHKTAGKRSLELSLHCESAQCATMRYSWYHRGCGLAVDFSESSMLAEITGPKGCVLLKGEWPVQVTLDDQIQFQMDGWEENCWFSDDDLDYIELEAKFGESAKVQRQLVLFRKERLILAADALLGGRDGQWTLQSEIPLSSEVHWQPADKHSEGFLVGPDVRCLVIPVFLPEWRSPTLPGSLQVKSNNLVTCNSSQGASSIYSPVMIGIANRQASQPYTWRQLTVAENLQILPRDKAAAFRLQYSKKQIVLYRNLSEIAKRSLLGIHLMSDFFAGRIDKESGEVDSLVEIDPIATENS